ncbi:unnamed protein product [Paramecium sonneborni]|uniref:Uncharacterized protein n=1 Tax=Paramecium sonneborni TaxID=65129 RepID=A0A8S1RCU3_9CILI|nr:unnamed protein product [Paramecium sonneborni]
MKCLINQAQNQDNSKMTKKKPNIQTIQIVSRPLSVKLSKVKNNGKENWVMNKLKEFLYDQDWSHYAVIISTAEKKVILHNLNVGFVSENIQDYEINEYKKIYVFQASDFKEPIYEEDLIQLSKGNQKYNLQNNSCIHFVNKVIIYLNERQIEDKNKEVKIQLNSLKHTFKQICKKSWMKIVEGWQTVKKRYQKGQADSKVQSDMNLEVGQNVDKKVEIPQQKPQKIAQNLLSLCTQITEYIFWNLHNLSFSKVIAMILILALLKMLTQIPVMGGFIAIASICYELFFIWEQKDDSILEKIGKSCSTFFLIIVGTTCPNLIQILYRFSFNLTSKFYERFKSKMSLLEVLSLLHQQQQEVLLVIQPDNFFFKQTEIFSLKIIFIFHFSFIINLGICTFSSSIALCTQAISETVQSFIVKKLGVDMAGTALVEASQVGTCGAILSNPVVITAVIGFCVGVGCLWIGKKLKWF